MWKSLLAGLTAIALLTGCGDSTGPEGQANLSVNFRAATPGASASVADADGPAAHASVGQGSRSLVLTGTNGTLQLDGIWLIVSEIELERTDNGCDEAADEDACEEFEAPPQFIELALEGGEVPVVEQPVPPDLYEELEFEIEDLELDDDEDEAKASALQALFADIQSQIPDWPAEASLLVEGSFTPTGGTATDFRAFFEAEIEIEIEFPAPGLDLTGDSDATATVVLDPGLWFERPDGTVVDLSQFAGQLVEFEAEIESLGSAFSEIEVEFES